MITRIGFMLISLNHLIKGEDVKIKGPITSHFDTWLNSNGYAADEFARHDMDTQGSYGRKKSDADNITRIPVLFFHGNSDAALRTLMMGGWENSIDYLQQQGYTSAELYATSWGDTNALMANTRTHSCETIQRLRRFIEAVKNYTEASNVHIISHSFGVTLARKAIKGGTITADDGSCNVGKRLVYIDVFVGIAGANHGLCMCTGIGTLLPTCNEQDGFWPGDSCGSSTFGCGSASLQCDGPPKYSSILTDMNTAIEPEGKRIASSWSTADDLIMNGDLVWGRPTSLLPRSTDQKVYTQYSHMETKESTAEDQYNWVNRKN